MAWENYENNVGTPDMIRLEMDSARQARDMVGNVVSSGHVNNDNVVRVKKLQMAGSGTSPPSSCGGPIAFGH